MPLYTAAFALSGSGYAAAEARRRDLIRQLAGGPGPEKIDREAEKGSDDHPQDPAGADHTDLPEWEDNLFHVYFK